MNDERLLEWILDPQSRDERTQALLDGDPGARRRLDELSGFLDGVRSAALEVRSEEDAARTTAPLAQRILARTTREDLSWRGDLALIGRHLRGRLASSVWMKLVAASLLVHLIALPALAYYVFVARPEAPSLSFIKYEDYRPEGFPEDVEEPAPELEDHGDEGDELDELLSPEDR